MHLSQKVSKLTCDTPLMIFKICHFEDGSISVKHSCFVSLVNWFLEYSSVNQYLLHIFSLREGIKIKSINDSNGWINSQKHSSL